MAGTIISILVGAAVSTAIGGAITIGGAAIFGGSLLASFLVRAAVGLALNALAPKPKSPTLRSRGYTVNQRGSALDHQVVYGRMRVGGAIVFQGTTGENNSLLHQVVAYTGHEIDFFDEIYINDARVSVLEADGNVKTVELPDGTTSNRYDGFIRLKTHRGTADQAADSDLVAEVDSWTTDHRLRGIAYIYARLKFNQDVFPNGVPQITTKIKGKKVYDPRTDTFGWSDNPALCLRDYLVSGYGLNEEDVNIDDSLVIAAANVCDETNTVAGTTRYTCNGAFTTNTTPYETLNDILTSMGGLLWYAQGQWRMKPAYYVAPTVSFDENDLRSSIAVKTRHSRRDNFNTVRGTFRGPETDFQVTDYPEVTNSAFLAADNGQESVVDIELPFTDNSIEARRIARIALERNRQQLTVSAAFGLRGFQVQVGDIISLSVERFGWTNKEFEVVSWTFGLTDAQDLQVQMTLREISASVFDEVDDGVVYERDNTTLPDPFISVAPQNLVVSDGGFTTEDGTFVNSFIVDWDAPDDAFVDFYVLEWRVQGDSKFKSVQLKTTEYQISPVFEDVTYDIRVKAVNVLGVSGPYASTTATVGGDTTAPGLPTSVSATGGFEYITVDWTNPVDADLSYVEVHENDTNTTVGATLVGTSSGNQFVRTNLGISETKFFFLRAVDYSGNKSGFTAGVSGTTTFIDDADFENGIRTLFEDQGLYPIEDVASLPASGQTGQKVFNRADGKLYEWNGSAWVLVVASAETDDLIGQITETQISDNAISTPKLQAGAVTATEIAGSTITGDKIVANTITGGLLATSGIITNSAQINDSLITNAKIQNAAITNAKIQNAAVDTLKIQDQAVTVPTFVFSDYGGTSISGTSFVTVLSSTINRLGVPTFVSISGSVDGISGDSFYRIRLVKDSTVIQEFDTAASSRKSFALVENDTASDTGSTTYTVQMQIINGVAGRLYEIGMFISQFRK